MRFNLFSKMKQLKNSQSKNRLTKKIASGLLFLALGFTGGLVVSCGPRDVAVERGSGGGGAASGPVTVSANGERSATCPTDFTDSMALRSPVELDEKVFSGKVTASLGAGDRNCFRIGATVNLQNGNQGVVRGSVVVKRVEVVAVSSLTASHASAFDMSLDELKKLAEKEIAAVTFNAKGMVNMTFFEYQTGTAVVVPQAEDILIFEKEGERSSTCPADFNDSTFLRSPLEFDEKVFAQKITAALTAGDRNCFKIGSIVTLKNGSKEEERGKVQVLKVEIVPIASLTEAHAQALDMTLEEIKALADKEIASVNFNAKGTVNITHFKLDGVEPVVEDKPAGGLEAEIFKILTPVLKMDLEKKLSQELLANNVSWDTSTLKVTYAKAISTSTFQGLLDLIGAAPLEIPSYRVEFRTQKGNTLVLSNTLVDGERLWAMEPKVSEKKQLDIEGSILGVQQIWSAPQGFEVSLFNETTQEKSAIVLSESLIKFSVVVSE